MNAFVGIVSLDRSPIDRATEEAAGRVIAGRDRERSIARRLPDAFVVRRSSPPDSAALARHAPGNGVFAAVARLDNRGEVGAALGLGSAELASTPDAVLLRRAVERWGDAGAARCVGAFAFASWDGDAGRLTLGRDCLGNVPLFYCRLRNRVAFATSLRLLLALPGVPREIDAPVLADFLAVNLGGDPRRTFYRGIDRVPSRSLATIGRDGVRERRYWAPDRAAAAGCARDEDYVERARELWDQAVAAALRDTPRIAIALSGGLDSSAIAATAARLGGAAVTCFTLVPPPDAPRVDVGHFKYWDERGKVEALARRYPALDLRFVAPQPLHPVDADDTRYFARAQMPALGPAGLGAWAQLCDAATASGHQTLLLGGKGNFGLSWSGRFALGALLRSGRLAAFAREWRADARQTERSLARVMAAGVLLPSAPAALRRLGHRLRGRAPDDVGRYSALNPEFIADAGLVRQWRQQGFDPWFAASDPNGARYRAYRLFDFNQPGRDTAGMARDILGCETRDPHADRRLLEFLLAVPEPMYCRDGVPRSLARRVLADRLPPEILDERRHGAHTVAWFRTLDAGRDRIAADIERLEASPLARRLLDLPRLRRLVKRWPEDPHAAERRRDDYQLALARGIHIGRFIRWVEGANA